MEAIRDFLNEFGKHKSQAAQWYNYSEAMTLSSFKDEIQETSDDSRKKRAVLKRDTSLWPKPSIFGFQTECRVYFDFDSTFINGKKLFD